MIHLATIDFVFIAIYILLVLFVGFWARKNETEEGFLLADRKLASLEGAATIVASNTGAGLLLTGVALTYVLGVTALWFFVGAGAGYIIFGYFGSKIREESSDKKFYTLADYFFDKYTPTVGYIVASVSLVIMSLNIILQLIGGAKVFTSITGVSFIFSLLLISLTIGAYLLLGGFKAVVKTDIVQTLAIVILIGLLGFVMSHGEIVSILKLGFSVGEMDLLSIVGFFILGVLIPFASPEIWQRVYASASKKVVQRSFFYSALLYMIVGILIFIVGLSIGADLRGIDPDLALVEGFATLLPQGVLGLGLVMLLATIMSSADTYVFTGTSIVLQDFYGRLNSISSQNLVKLFRYVIVLLLIVGVAIAWMLQSVVSTAFIWTGIIISLALPIFSTFIIPKTSSDVLRISIPISFLGVLVLIFIGPISEQLVLNSLAVTLCTLVLTWVFVTFNVKFS